MTFDYRSHAERRSAGLWLMRTTPKLGKAGRAEGEVPKPTKIHGRNGIPSKQDQPGLGLACMRAQQSGHCIGLLIQCALAKRGFEFRRSRRDADAAPLARETKERPLGLLPAARMVSSAP